jgi:anti-sigma regulatory factor (Ser/Thr protein kinase)
VPADQLPLDLALPSRPESAALVRHTLARVLPAPDLDEDGLADLQLLASELVTNAVRHGEPGTIFVKVTRTPAHIRIEVTNPGRPFAPPPERARDTAGGFGLPLIRRLSSHWGIRPAGPAVTVWLDYARPRRRTPTR